VLQTRNAIIVTAAVVSAAVLTIACSEAGTTLRSHAERTAGQLRASQGLASAAVTLPTRLTIQPDTAKLRLTGGVSRLTMGCAKQESGGVTRYILGFVEVPPAAQVKSNAGQSAMPARTTAKRAVKSGRRDQGDRKR
jgi:hypothetical protein